jgi:hypothetical protein
MTIYTVALIGLTSGLAGTLATPSALPVAAAASHAVIPDSCAPLSQPKRMPNLTAVLDSTGLMARLQALDTASAGSVIVGIIYSSAPSGHIIERSPPTPASELVLSHVLASLRSPSKGAPPAFRVHIQLGPTPVLELKRSRLCRPQSVEPGGDVLRIGYGQVQGSSASAGVMPAKSRSITPSLRISATGQVEEVSIGPGTGILELDRSLREGLMVQRFHPALLDGRPVAVWVSGTKVGLIP